MAERRSLPGILWGIGEFDVRVICALVRRKW